MRFCSSWLLGLKNNNEGGIRRQLEATILEQSETVLAGHRTAPGVCLIALLADLMGEGAIWVCS